MLELYLITTAVCYVFAATFINVASKRYIKQGYIKNIKLSKKMLAFLATMPLFSIPAINVVAMIEVLGNLTGYYNEIAKQMVERGKFEEPKKFEFEQMVKEESKEADDYDIEQPIIYPARENIVKRKSFEIDRTSSYKH